MIFAELQYKGHYSDQHDALVALLGRTFRHLEAGHQCDSWIWVLDGEEKVAIDSFSSMQHQVKSARPGPHVQRVIEALRCSYPLAIVDPPQWEAHEDGEDETTDSGQSLDRPSPHP